MANTTHYVNPGADAGGNGTTSALTGANCAYKSLAIAEDAIDGTAYGAGETATINCAGSTADTTAVAFNGWDADVAITINGNNTSGKWNTSAYRIEYLEAETPFRFDVSNVTVVNMQVKLGGANQYGFAAFYTSDGVGNILVRNSIFDARNDFAIRWWNYTATGKFWNCVFIQRENNSVAITLLANIKLYNCVIIQLGTQSAFNLNGFAPYITNCYCYAASGTCYGSSTNLATSAASDTTGTAAGLDNVAYSTSSGAYFTNVGSGTEDFHIGASSALKDVGTDLSATFTDDIDGVTRSGTWDIGADEYVAATSTPLSLKYLVGEC